MPVMVLGPSARAASATRVGASSPASERSRSTPRMPRPPSAPARRRTVSRSPSTVTVAPNSGSRSARAGAPTWVVVGRPAGDRDVSRRRRAPRRGTVRRWRGRARCRRRSARIGPGATIQRPGSGLVDVDAARARGWRSSSRCAAGSAGARRRGAGRGRRSKRAAASSRPETNWLDAEASIVELAAGRPAGAVHGERQGAAAVVVDVDAEGAQRAIVAPIGRRRAPSSPSNVVGPRASAATGGRKRMTVPARPQSIVVRAEELLGGDDARSAPNSPVARHPLESRCRARAAPRPSARCRASAERRAQRRRAVGQRGEHEFAVGERLRAGQRHDGRRSGAGGDGRAPARRRARSAWRRRTDRTRARNTSRSASVIKSSVRETRKEMVRVSACGARNAQRSPRADDLGWPVMTADETDTTTDTTGDRRRGAGRSASCSRSRRCRSSTSSTPPRCA